MQKFFIEEVCFQDEYALNSPDVLWRGEFSVDNNLTYWEDDAKYGDVVQKIRER